MAQLKDIVFDCQHAPSLARFWAAALEGYAVRAYDNAEVARLADMGLTPETDPVVMVDGPGPGLCFQQVEHRANTANRLHLDLRVTNRAERDAEVARLCGLGARHHRAGRGYETLLDPEGNRFCVIEVG